MATEWKLLTKEFKASALPRECMVCGSRKRWRLRKRTSLRAGREMLMDCVPICSVCWPGVEQVMRHFAWTLADTAQVLSKSLGISGSDAVKRVGQFSLYGGAWEPSGKADLLKMRNKLGHTAFQMQHWRLFNGELPKLEMTDEWAAEYCRCINQGWRD